MKKEIEIWWKTKTPQQQYELRLKYSDIIFISFEEEITAIYLQEYGNQKL